MVFANNEVIAHRGTWKSKGLPENSIASLKQAIKMNCAGSEFDVRITSDEVLIVTHDPKYHEMLIEETTYADLSKIKLSNGEMLPKLKDMIIAGMEGNDSTGLVCEIKPSKIANRNKDITNKTLQLVKALNAEAYVSYYISFDYDIIKHIKKLQPESKVLYLDGSKAPKDLSKDQIDGLDYAFFKMKKNPQWIKEAKDYKLILNAWTVNKIEDIDWLLDHGFDYITTNEPELVFKRINERANHED
jgi:glycerophosphoryl diester phosphodiesterase